MNKKSHKKKQKKRGKNDDAGRNKENVKNAEDVEVGEKKEDEKEEVKPNRVIDKKDVCYDVRHSKEMGRYLVASRDIRPGEVIVKQPALVVGPCAGCGVVCLGCYKELDESNIPQCEGCKWPLCSKACPGNGKYTGHSTEECKILKDNPPKYSNIEDLKESYHALTPLRCLLLKTTDQVKWKALSAMEAHNEIRRARGDIWPANEKNVVQRIKKWGLDYDSEDIHTVCGILEVNAFEVGGDEGAGSARALYDDAYLLAHSCTPSTTHTDAPACAGRPLCVRAARSHAAGDLITLCYAYTLQGTLRRREHLSLSKFFECACARCADPTELGTHASSFRCPTCGGNVQPTTPLDSKGAWSCDACAYVMTAAAVRLLLERLTAEYDRLDINDVEGLEMFLHKYRNVTHESHYLRLSALHSLSQLYGKVPQYLIHQMTDRQLTRKIQICRQLMRAFDVIEPGYSRLRGVTLYELHAPLMILTTRDFEKKAITKDELRRRLKEIVKYLKEAALILGFEPPRSSEGLMASAARDALTKIKTWEQIIGNIS